MISEKRDILLSLHVTGLLFNFATFIYIVTNFNIKVHVYTLLFIDSLICMTSSLGLIILDTFFIYGIWNNSFWYCNTWFFTLLLPTYCGGILTFLVAAIRYILALKASKNIQPSNKTVSCWSLSFFFFGIFVITSFICINIWMDIPIAMMIEICASSQERPGVNSSTYLHTAFTPVAPQSVRTQSSCQYLFTLLGSSSVKAVHRTLMKLSPGVNSSTFYEHLFCQWISTDMNGAWRRAGMSNWRPHCLFNAARNDLFNILLMTENCSKL